MDVGFGRCYRTDDTRAVWAYCTHPDRPGLVDVRAVTDDAHFSILVKRCAACGQLFVWVYNELLDWGDDNDPADISVVPVTEEEATRATDLEYLHAIGQSRRWLHHSYGGEYGPSPAWRQSGLAIWGR